MPPISLKRQLWVAYITYISLLPITFPHPGIFSQIQKLLSFLSQVWQKVHLGFLEFYKNISYFNPDQTCHSYKG